MNLNYLEICQRVNRKTWITPALIGVAGGVVGTLGSSLSMGGQLLFQALYWTLGYKLVVISAGAGMGWKIGHRIYGPNDAIMELVKDPQLWKLLRTSYQSQDKKEPYKRMTAISLLQDTSRDIGKLYQFSLFLFIERYGEISQDLQLMTEFKSVVSLLTQKHPMYQDGDTTNKSVSGQNQELQDLIERRVIEDLYPYIYSHYLRFNKTTHQKLNPQIKDRGLIVATPPKNNNQITCQLTEELAQLTSSQQLQAGKSLDQASKTFRQLSYHVHPKDKAAILIKMVKDISSNFQEVGINVSCDLLIPLVSKIILDNMDMVPAAEIKMTYDYLGHLTNEDGYVITVLLSSLLACVELQNR